MSRERELDAWIDGLLADPQFHGHPLHQALARLRQQSLEQLVRLERIARISDGFQSMAREQNLSLSERYHKQLRRLEKVARISDRYQQMMRDLNLALKEASIRDPLTGLPNRRMLLERLREENERSQRHGQSYVLAMLDVDFFKQVNDTWGHDSGDRVLVEIARAMESELREYDLCGRWGGEEFPPAGRRPGTRAGARQRTDPGGTRRHRGAERHRQRRRHRTPHRRNLFADRQSRRRRTARRQAQRPRQMRVRRAPAASCPFPPGSSALSLLRRPAAAAAPGLG